MAQNKVKLTVKEKKLLKRLKNAWKYRYISYTAFSCLVVKSIVCIIKSIIREDDGELMYQYSMLLLSMIAAWTFYYILRLYKIVEKLESEMTQNEGEVKY